MAFARLAGENAWLPGGCFWIPAHGTRANLVSALASFAEYLLVSKLNDHDRQDLMKLIAMLQRRLKSLNGIWLICLDISDNPQGNSAVGEIYCLSSLGGWIVFTSSQGGHVMWDEIVLEQKLKFDPLSHSDAVAVFIRWKNGWLAETMNDAFVATQLICLNDQKPLEQDHYRKLQAVRNSTAWVAFLSPCLKLETDLSFSTYVERYEKM